MAVTNTLNATVAFIPAGTGQFKGDLEIGHTAEGYVADVLRDARYVEVKHDAKTATTSNLYVEYQHCPNGEWKNSGVATSQSDFFAYVIGQLILLVPTAVLRDLARDALKDGRKARCDDSDCPTKGALVPVKTVLERMASSE